MKLPEILETITKNNLDVLFRPLSWQNTGNAFIIKNNQVIPYYQDQINPIINVNLLMEDWIMIELDLINNERSCNY